jgi:hypothetical protein
MRFKRNDVIQERSFIFSFRQDRRFMASKLLALILFLSSSIVEYSYAKSNQINSNHEDGISETLPQPVAPSLPAVKGGKKITLDWLLTQSIPGWDRESISWFDNNQVIYSSASIDSNQEHLIELINIETNVKQRLGRGDDPVVSPDKQWIAFVQGKNELRQLWIMDRFGKNLRQISHVKDGLFPSNFFTKYIWSPDSRQLVLLYKQNYNYEDPDKITPPSKVELIDVVTSQISSLGSFDNRIKDFSWIPNSNEILFTQERFGFEYKDDINYELISTLNIENKKIRTLSKFNGNKHCLLKLLLMGDSSLFCMIQKALYLILHKVLDSLKMMGIRTIIHQE